jgi:hypothetical protein
MASHIISERARLKPKWMPSGEKNTLCSAKPWASRASSIRARSHGRRPGREDRAGACQRLCQKRTPSAVYRVAGSR